MRRMEETKACSTCKKILALSLFFKAPDRKYGRDSQCKSCKYKAVCKKKRVLRDAKRYEKNKIKPHARAKARKYYQGIEFKCSVLGCEKNGRDLHHVNYEKPLDVIPLCTEHHKMNHTVK